MKNKMKQPLFSTINNKLIKNQKLNQVINLKEVLKKMLERQKNKKKKKNKKRKKMKTMMKMIAHFAVNVANVQLDQLIIAVVK